MRSVCLFSEAVKASFIQTFTDRYQDGYFMGCVACFFYWLFIDQGFTDELQTFFHNPDDSSVIFREIIRTNHLPLKLYDVCKLGMAAKELSEALEKKKDKYVTYVQKLTVDYFIRPYDPSVLKTDTQPCINKTRVIMYGYVIITRTTVGIVFSRR